MSNELGRCDSDTIAEVRGADRMRAPILFIHGASGKPAHFESWIRYFRAGGHQCLAPALPGHAPDDPAALARLTLDDYVAAMGEAIAGLEAPPVVIGYSMGGVVAQMLAAGVECAGLVLLASPPAGFMRPQWPLVAEGWRYAWPVLRGRAFRPTPATLKALLLHDLSVAEQDEVVTEFGHESGRVMRSLALGRARVAARDLRCPVLVVNGSRDRIVGLSAAAGLARRYAAELVLVPGRGHWLLADSLFGTIVPLVRDWIGRLPEPAGLPSFRPAADL